MKSIPAQPSVQCPNCFQWFTRGSLGHSSTRTEKSKHGTYSSTLYGVCSGCAERHSLTWEDAVKKVIEEIRSAPKDTAP